MADRPDEDLYRRVRGLLEPGDVRLNGVVVHTRLGPDAESRMHRTTVEIGQLLADRLTNAETYVYSGNDDPEFGLNQHQGRTLGGDEFVWECQQLLRDGSYDLVFYYEARVAQQAILADLETAGHNVMGVGAPADQES